jgi:hypothetical protein
MERAPYMDQLGLYARDNVIRSLQQEGILLACFGLQD